MIACTFQSTAHGARTLQARQERGASNTAEGLEGFWGVQPTCCDWCTAMAEGTSPNSTKQVMERCPRTSLSWRKPGWCANRARSSSSLVASARLPMNSVLHGGLSFVLFTGT